MTTKLEKMASKLNEDFRDEVIAEMKNVFGIEVENNFNFGAMALVTTRVDGKDFTAEEKKHLAGYSNGFAAAMNLVSAGL